MLNDERYFRHSVNSMSDSRIISLVMQYPNGLGLSVWWGFCEVFYREKKAVGKIGISSISQGIGAPRKKVIEILDFCCTEDCGYLLYKDNDGNYRNMCADKELAWSEENVEKRKRASEKRWNKDANAMHMDSTCNANGMHMHTKSNAKAIQHNITYHNIDNNSLYNLSLNETESREKESSTSVPRSKTQAEIDAELMAKARGHL